MSSSFVLFFFNIARINFYAMVIELLGQKYVFKFGLDAILVNRLCKPKFLVRLCKCALLTTPSQVPVIVILEQCDR